MPDTLSPDCGQGAPCAPIGSRWMTLFSSTFLHMALVDG
jgi:hypothetical protein